MIDNVIEASFAVTDALVEFSSVRWIGKIAFSLALERTSWFLSWALSVRAFCVRLIGRLCTRPFGVRFICFSMIYWLIGDWFARWLGGHVSNGNRDVGSVNYIFKIYLYKI